MPMVHALKAKGWNAEVIFLKWIKKMKFYKYVKENFDGYVSRIKILATLKKKMSILIC